MLFLPSRPGGWRSTRPARQPETIISYPDSVKRLEAYLQAEGLPAATALVICRGRACHPAEQLGAIVRGPQR